MADLDDIKGVIPEGLYLNISNLLKAEYTRQAKTTSQTQPVVNNITLNIQSLNISVPETIPEPVIASVQEPEPEPEQVWRVYEILDDGVWDHIVLDRNGQYNQRLEGDYDDVLDALHDVIDDYVSALSLEDAKYYVERYGLANALDLYIGEYGNPTLDDGDERLYKQLCYAIINSSLMVHHEQPARPRF